MHDSSHWLPARGAASPFFAGIDLGGTNIKVGLVDNAGRTLAFHTEPTHVSRGPEDAACRMGRAVHTVANLAGIAPAEIAAVGLGTPGPQDIPTGTIIRAGNANAAAYGEFWVGSGQEYSSLLLLTLGTGVGGGIVIGNEALEGAHSHASECGHIIVDPAPSARKCPCGHTGHLEAYTSATALQCLAREALDSEAGRLGPLATAVAGGEELTPILIASAAAAGDTRALEIILNSARWLGIGVVSLMHTIDPAAVVLGGAMTFGGEQSPIGRAFLERVRQEVRMRALPTLAAQTPIRFARLGGDAGYIGAAGMARASLQNSRHAIPTA